GEGRDRDVEQPAVLAHHLVRADHDARRGAERTAGRVGERLTGGNDGRLSNHTRPSHLVRLADGIGNAPDAAFELDRVLALVRDLDGVNPKKIAFFGSRLVIGKFGQDADTDTLGHLLVWEIVAHKARPLFVLASIT